MALKVEERFEAIEASSCFQASQSDAEVPKRGFWSWNNPGEGSQRFMNPDEPSTALLLNDMTGTSHEERFYRARTRIHLFNSQ